MPYKDPVKKNEADKRYYQRNKDKIKNYNTEYRRKNLNKVRNSYFQRTYKLTLEAYNSLVEKQEGKCAICGRLDDNLCVDHDHISHKVRGLLCRVCNPLLGYAGDNVEILLNAARYLKEVEKSNDKCDQRCY